MPLANTFTLLEKIVLSSAQSQVTFMTSGNISSNYTDLVVMMSVRSSTTSGNSNLLMWLNGVTGTSYSYYQGFGDGNGNQTRAVLSSQPWFELSPIIPNANGSFSASTFANCQVWIQDYRRADGDGTAINSLFYSESNVTSVLTGTLTGTFANTTNPITSITIDGTDNFVAGSTFYLYGIANTTKSNMGPSATGGNTIATDGTYWYHAFTSSGTFTPTKALTCDVLVVAGGGAGNFAGAGRIVGGGGAGGLLAHTSQSLSATGYTVTVGAGGSLYTNGSNSQFGALTAAVGGGLGGGAGAQGNSGGSGGGGGDAIGAGGIATLGQGNNGGNGQSTSGGGGGGAGATGSNGTASTNGKGGVGVNTYSSWATATSTGDSGYFAGGGGGGLYMGSGTGTSQSAALGGGGLGGTYWSGATQQNATSGTANTGGGGGGYGLGVGGGTGGSGIVIVRYAV